MDNFSVKEYQADDYNGVQNLWIQTGMGGAERGDNSETIQRSIELGGKLLVLINSEESEIVGTSWLTFDGRRVHLHHFGILPYYQGRGLSKILLDASLKHVKKIGCQVKLEVHNTNIKAINLYSSYGFGYLGDYDVYIIRDLESIEVVR